MRRETGKDALDAAEAGASILHLYARDPQTGRPTPKADVFMQYLPRIKQQTDAVINITTAARRTCPSRNAWRRRGKRRPSFFR